MAVELPRQQVHVDPWLEPGGEWVKDGRQRLQRGLDLVRVRARVRELGFAFGLTLTLAGLQRGPHRGDEGGGVQVGLGQRHAQQQLTKLAHLLGLGLGLGLGFGVGG